MNLQMKMMMIMMSMPMTMMEEEDWPGVGGEELGVHGEDVGVAAPPPQPGHAAVAEPRHPALQPGRGQGLSRGVLFVVPSHFKSVQSSHFPHILKLIQFLIYH